jgi:hypothetical protein
MIDEPEVDNLVSAIAREAESNDKAVSNEISPEDGPAGKNILIRLTEKDRERWKEAAEKMGLTVSQMIRDTVNAKVQDVIDCSHPISQRRYYPWSEFCLACGTRLR